MVQRKAPNKLGIQSQADDHVKSHNLKPKKPSSFPQDVKNRGAELKKKKMKKSGSFKRPDSEQRLRSSPSSRPWKIPSQQPGKPRTPPPPDVSTPQKQSPVKSPEASPNYMKSTSSFDARKEPSEKVSAHACISTKSSNMKKHSSVSVRTLTKTPSFKPARASKKCSSVVVCENFDVQRATCSSTLKDTKFPNYLTLNPGATESEGTSAMKVCPYTSCSLNGHRHASLPPLKSFLSARRRSLKSQKSIKLGCLSPRRAKPYGEKIDKRIDAEEEFDSSPPFTLPVKQEEDIDFFVEIYANNKDIGDGKLMDMLLKIESAGSLDQSSDVNSTETDIADLFLEEDAKVDWFSNQGDGEVRSEATIQADELDSEASDMDWEAGQYSSKPCFDDADDVAVSESDDILVQGSFDEQSVRSEAWLDDDGDSEVDETCESISNHQSHDPISSFVLTKEEICEGTESDETLGTEEGTGAPVEEDPFHEEPKATSESTATTIENDGIPRMDLELEDSGTMCMCDVNDETDIKEEADAAKLLVGEEVSDLLQGESEADQKNKDSESMKQTSSDEGLSVSAAIQDQSQTNNLAEDENQSETDGEKALDDDVQTHSEIQSNAEETKVALSHVLPDSNLEHPNASSNPRGMAIRCKKGIDELEEARKFNPRDPNFLPLEPDPEAEAVDLRHQMMDERKNAEEWMLDYAVRQAVTKLAPARSRKVALLVEAFETVAPVPKYNNHLRHTSAAFAHSRPIQACR